MLILSPQQIVGGFNRKDHDAGTWLYKHYYDHVFEKVVKVTRDPDKSKDLTADIFEILFSNKSRFGSLRGIRAFLDNVTTNTCQDHMRKQKTIRENSFEVKDRYPLVDEYAQELIEISITHKMLFYTLVKQLSPKAQKILVLSIRSPLSDKEIAEKLKISVKSVANQKADVVKKLRMKIEKLRGLELFLLAFTFLKIFYKQL